MTNLKGCTNTKKVEDHRAKQSNVTPINKTFLGICISQRRNKYNRYFVTLNEEVMSMKSQLNPYKIFPWNSLEVLREYGVNGRLLLAVKLCITLPKFVSVKRLSRRVISLFYRKYENICSKIKKQSTTAECFFVYVLQRRFISSNRNAVRMWN